MVLAYQDILHMVKNMPTADVVPKSEVEELKKDRYQALPDGRLELLPRTDIDKIKTEVAREIFEEIEENISENLNRNYADRYFNLIVKIAELKKKYTEGEK
jgi:hypothetical protein